MRVISRSICLVVLFALGCSEETTSAGSKDAGSDAAAPPVDTCEVDSDCGWGEIDREILEPKQCMCLLGCPHLPLPKVTVQRRLRQHGRLCDPQRGGDGKPCPIDDCAEPPPVECRAGKCVPAGADIGG